jgi:hypothetical protein
MNNSITEKLPIFNKLSKSERNNKYKAYSELGQFFGIECSPSSRSKCKGCKKLIEISTLRMRHVVCGSKCCNEKLTRHKDSCGSWHLLCMLSSQVTEPERFLWTNRNWEELKSVDKIAGYSLLTKIDQDKVKTIIESNNLDRKTPNKKQKL